MSRGSIFACLDPRGAEWQLGALPPPAGRLMLIGWREEPPPVDGGVPPPVAATFSRALTSIGRITYLSSTVPAPAGGGWPPLKRGPAPVDLLSTSDPQELAQAFEDAAHPWWMQGQVLLVSAPGAAPPAVERRQLLSLLEDEWTSTARALSPLGVIGVMRPGVDGDLAGLLTFTAAAEQASLAALERETLLASFDWSVVTEEAFAERYRG